MPSSVSLLESKLGPANLNLDSKLGIPASLNSQNDISTISDAGFDSGFNDQDSASSQQSADSVKSDENSVMSSNNSDSRGSSLEKSPASDTQWGFLQIVFGILMKVAYCLDGQVCINFGVAYPLIIYKMVDNTTEFLPIFQFFFPNRNFTNFNILIFFS